MVAAQDSELDFVPRLSFLPIEWRTIGSAFGLKDQSGAAASGRATFVVKQGVDAAELTSTGRVIDGQADVGASLKLNTLAIGVSASNITFHSGLDDPTAAAAQRSNLVPSLKLTAAKQFKRDNYVAVSYDLKHQKPELSACWTGEAGTDRATLLVNVDPVMRSMKLAAAVRTPGPEWRKVLYNDETDLLEYPADDGARHTLYVQHEVRGRDLLHSTRMGCRLDLGRLVNYVADFVDYRVEENIPSFVWNVPLLPQLYSLLVPPDNDEQVRHHITGWELDVSHDFARSGLLPVVALSKTSKKLLGGGTLAASYDAATREAGLSLSRKGVSVGARVARADGATGGLAAGWGRPSIHIAVEPLSLLQ
ncbi:hypothetical protein HYH02_005306 [Chlamydomonas schloesseri]|uniref:Uncharacterized protein n=1 Tax=Chlamydomonas schloesseri TaxID=2026947 RepID=A0A836B7A1_9CHLO|nr:hypothetical protein HYH02_005306 [Chlamydomonas schloesseri]|eukprot:KAG2449782.1 hypothetical protein HYH02_005306 [Chlamydomonas schloesseri]